MYDCIYNSTVNARITYLMFRNVELFVILWMVLHKPWATLYIYSYSYIYIDRSCHRMIRVIYGNIVMIAKSWCYCSKLQNHQASLRYSGDGVFLDSDELQDLDSLFECVRAHTSFVVPLLTPGLLTRPWCVGELATAFLNRVTGPQWKDVEGCDRPFQSGGRFR